MKISTLLPSKFTGIIQLVPQDDFELIKLQKLILEREPTQQPIMKKGKLAFHITLLHQSVPKRYGQGQGRGDKLLKNFYKSGQQFDIATPTLKLGDVFMSTQDDRTSTYVKVINQNACFRIRDEILKQAGINLTGLQIDGEELNRVFHISLTNLTSNGGDSIAYPRDFDDLMRLQ